MADMEYTTDGTGYVYRLPSSTKVMDCARCKRLIYRPKRMKPGEKREIVACAGYRYDRGHRRPLCGVCFVILKNTRPTGEFIPL